jgi:hypothetical protein
MKLKKKNRKRRRKDGMHRRIENGRREREKERSYLDRRTDANKQKHGGE